jgi:hypothetical protein
MMKNPLASVIVVLSMGRGYWRSRHDRQAEEALPRCFVADAGQRRSAGGEDRPIQPEPWHAVRHIDVNQDSHSYAQAKAVEINAP